MAITNKIKTALTHQGKGWWNLPSTQQDQPTPQYEGPIGGPWLRDFFNWVTYAGKSHANPRFYLVIATILTVVTYLEYRLFSVDAFGISGRNTIMLALSLLKFVMVVGFFMHLRFDNKYYAWIFASCMILGISVFLALLMLSRHHGLGG